MTDVSELEVLPLRQRLLAAHDAAEELDAMTRAAWRVRARAAKELNAEGLTHEELGRLLGVSRERIGMLIRGC